MSRDRLITEHDAETILSGIAGDPEFDELVEFVGALQRTAMDHEIGPSAFQVAMSAGFSHDKGDLPATAASNVTGPAPQAAGLPNRRKRMPIPAFIAGLTLAGKLTVGASLVAAAGTGAAATGSLPGPAQNAAAAVVSTVSPFDLPRSGGVEVEEVEDDVILAVTTEEEVEAPGEVEVPEEPEPLGGPEKDDDGSEDATFGAAVSAMATESDTGVDGSEISRMARHRFQDACQIPDGDDNEADSGGTDETALETADVDTTDEERPGCRPDGAGQPEPAGRQAPVSPPATAGRSEPAGPPATPARSDAAAQSDDQLSTSNIGRSARDSAPAPVQTPPAASIPAATDVAPETSPSENPPPQSPPVADVPASPAETPGRP